MQEIMGTIKNMNEQIKNLKRKNDNLHKKLGSGVVNLERYSRRNNLRFFRISEEQDEDIEREAVEIICDKNGRAATRICF